jgi:hypothetical protein
MALLNVAGVEAMPGLKADARLGHRLPGRLLHRCEQGHDLFQQEFAEFRTAGGRTLGPARELVARAHARPEAAHVGRADAC